MHLPKLLSIYISLQGIEFAPIVAKGDYQVRSAGYQFAHFPFLCFLSWLVGRMAGWQATRRQVGLWHGTAGGSSVALSA